MRRDLLEQAERVIESKTALERRLAETAEQLQQKTKELFDSEAARDKLQKFFDTHDWGAIDSGASISAGDVVRFGTFTYKAKLDHTKALTRSPLNVIYWEVCIDV